MNRPQRGGSPDWLTGGPFGLEGSLAGLIVVIAACALVAALTRP